MFGNGDEGIANKRYFDRICHLLLIYASSRQARSFLQCGSEEAHKREPQRCEHARTQSGLSRSKYTVRKT